MALRLARFGKLASSQSCSFYGSSRIPSIVNGIAESGLGKATVSVD
jgi:hypothetical protein